MFGPHLGSADVHLIHIVVQRLFGVIYSFIEFMVSFRVSLGFQVIFLLVFISFTVSFNLWFHLGFAEGFTYGLFRVSLRFLQVFFGCHSGLLYGFTQINSRRYNW